MNKGKEEKLAEISARITQVIDYLGESSNSFATKLGYPRAQTVYDIQKMKSAPSYDFFQRFSRAGFSVIVDLDWLLTGEGSMLRTPQSPEGTKPESSPPISPPSKPDESILYNMYKDLQAEKEKIRLEKEAKIEELNAKMLTMSEEIGRLKAIVGEENDRETPEVLSKGAVEDVSGKKRSLQPARGIPFANVPSDGRHQ